jgi:hypothetical protein
MFAYDCISFLSYLTITYLFPFCIVSFPATIMATLPDSHCLVKWEDGEDDTNLYKFPEALIWPCILTDLERRGDDDDLAPVPPAEHDTTLASSVFENVLDALSAVGEYTAVFDATFGHVDNFTHTDAPLLENKWSFIMGEEDQTVLLDSYQAKGRVPPGGLAYPRYKVATVSFASSDVELHCLHADVHFGPRQDRSDHLRFRRGSWLRQDGGESLFFPEGSAVLDWTSRENHQQYSSGPPQNTRRAQKRKIN